MSNVNTHLLISPKVKICSVRCDCTSTKWLPSFIRTCRVEDEAKQIPMAFMVKVAGHETKSH